MIRRSTGEQAAQYIRRLIFEGRLRQGDRVPQDDIAAALGISRIPVREALLSLEREGWITIRPHRGAFIDRLDEAVVRDLYVLYGMLYGLAVRRVAVDPSPDVVVRLEALCAGLADGTDPVTVDRLSGEFNRLVLESGSSPRLRALLRGVTGIVPGNFFLLVPGAIEVERQDDPAILAAIRDRRPDQAATAYSRKLERLGDLVIDLFRGRGLFAQSEAAD